MSRSGPYSLPPPEFWIGVSVSQVEPALRVHLKIPADQGLNATEVIAESPATKAELKVNDILLTMIGQPLRDQAGLVDLVQKNGEKTVALDIIREGSRQTLQVTPQRRKNLNLTPARVRIFRGFQRPSVLVLCCRGKSRPSSTTPSPMTRSTWATSFSTSRRRLCSSPR